MDAPRKMETSANIDLQRSDVGAQVEAKEVPVEHEEALVETGEALVEVEGVLVEAEEVGHVINVDLVGTEKEAAHLIKSIPGTIIELVLRIDDRNLGTKDHVHATEGVDQKIEKGVIEREVPVEISKRAPLYQKSVRLHL